MFTSDRKNTRKIKVGNLYIGGGAPVSVQSMTNTDTHDIDATERQTRALLALGCDIVRITAPDVSSADTFRILKERGIDAPLVADVHFDYRIAVACCEAGADKIRINPGNIGSRENVREVVRACRAHGVPIRIGVNSGSLSKEILKKYGAPTAEALVESALYHASLLEAFDFYDTVISVKASSTEQMIKANRILRERCDYPIHLGVTEAGGGDSAIVKSSVGIGTLLAEGIGDTVRVSLTADPTEEIPVAREILKSLGLLSASGMDIVSCPTCGRTRVDLISIVNDFKKRVRDEGLDKVNIKVAIMGCAVNGPGEAREADLGIACGVGEGLLIKSGEIVKKLPEGELTEALIREIRAIKNNA